VFLLVGAIAVPSFAQTIISSSNSSLVGQNISSVGLNITYGPGQVNYTSLSISGRISFYPNNYNNVTSVTQLTIYARSADGFDNLTNPMANGTFSIMVPGNGKYSIFVYPSTLDYLNNSTNLTYSVVYPDVSSPLVEFVTNDSSVTGIVIPGQIVQTGSQVTSTPIPSAHPTATPTPGFTAIVALVVIGTVAAIAYNNRRY
jgi:hypothetical protein